MCARELTERRVLYVRAGENFRERVPKLSTYFAEILPRAHGNFEEQNKFLHSSIIIINHRIIINTHYNCYCLINS